MTSTSNKIAPLSALLLLCNAVAAQPLRWASSGGGWRAMTANMAYSNVFTQAGLFGDETSSQFQAISTESGASWFSTQFFYSQPFFENVTTSSPTELSQFVLQWMNSYQTFSSNLTQDPNCDFLEDIIDIPPFQELASYCNLFVDFNGEWASFVSSMMAKASSDYDDAGLVDRTVSMTNRIPTMSETELYVQTTLTPNSRIRATNTGNYIGPGGADANSEQIYSLPICVQWTVANDQTRYFSTIPDSDLPLVAYEKTISDSFSFEEWNDYPFYPAEEGDTVLMDRPRESTLAGDLSHPFGGLDPTVGQIASASSAAIGSYSPVIPSTLAQYMSVERYDILNSNKSDVEQGIELEEFQEAINSAYGLEVLDGLAVCDQWPSNCTAVNGRFVDGGFSDAPTLALNIGQYQTRESGNLEETLKIILTFDSTGFYPPETVLAYFSTTFNQKVQPGALLWPESLSEFFSLPVVSPQIFEDFLDLEMLESMMESIDGINVTTTLINTTTIENPLFKTKAGQPVEILLLMLNYNIPTNIIGVDKIEEYKGPLVEMAQQIAASTVLVDRVKAFANGGESVVPSQAPSTSMPTEVTTSTAGPSTEEPTSGVTKSMAQSAVALFAGISMALFQCHLL